MVHHLLPGHVAAARSERRRDELGEVMHRQIDVRNLGHLDAHEVREQAPLDGQVTNYHQASRLEKYICKKKRKKRKKHGNEIKVSREKEKKKKALYGRDYTHISPCQATRPPYASWLEEKKKRNTPKAHAIEKKHQLSQETLSISCRTR